MTLLFENEFEIEFDFDPEQTARTVIQAALDDLQCPYETEVSLLLTDGDSIREMNLQMRGIDSETDVLSFPMEDFPEPGDFAWLEESGDAACFNPDTGELLLGDIVINTQRVFSQAAEYGHSVRREYAFLITHSILHLTGFDHMTPEDASLMEHRQEQILTGVGIPRTIGV